MNDDTLLEQRLRHARPEPAPDALQRVHGRLSRARALRARRRASMTMTALLAVGIVGTGSGGALAISGLSAQGTAAQVQYPPVSSSAPSSGGVAGIVTTAPTLGGGTGAANGSPGDASKQHAAPIESAPTGAVAADTVQASRQTAAAGGSSRLPLTGFLAIPVLLLGLASLAAGVVLRLRTRRADD